MKDQCGVEKRCLLVAETDLREVVLYLRLIRTNGVAAPQSTEAWGRFFGVCDQEIQSVLRRCHFRGADLEESTQEIWLKLLLSLERFSFNNDRAQFTTWLHTVIRNHLVDQLRRRVLRKTVPLTDATDAKASWRSCEPPEILQKQAEKQFVDRVLGELKFAMSEENHRILHRYWIEQKSIGEIAADTQFSPAQIRQRLCRIKRRLASYMLLHPMRPR